MHVRTCVHPAVLRNGGPAGKTGQALVRAIGPPPCSSGWVLGSIPRHIRPGVLLPRPHRGEHLPASPACRALGHGSGAEPAPTLSLVRPCLFLGTAITTAVASRGQLKLAHSLCIRIRIRCVDASMYVEHVHVRIYTYLLKQAYSYYVLVVAARESRMVAIRWTR